MEELLEIITWAQLGIHKKTVFDTISFAGNHKKRDIYYVNDEDLYYLCRLVF